MVEGNRIDKLVKDISVRAGPLEPSPEEGHLPRFEGMVEMIEPRHPTEGIASALLLEVGSTDSLPSIP